MTMTQPPTSDRPSIASGPRRRWQELPRWLRVLLIIVAILLLLRILLPPLMTIGINAALAGDGTYRLHIDGISLSFLRGSYRVDGAHLEVRQGGGRPQPLLDIGMIEADLSWTDLLHGQLAGTLAIRQPRLTVAQPVAADPTPRAAPTGASPGKPAPQAIEQWRDGLQRLVPFRLDELSISDGAVRFLDRQRGIDLGMDGIDGGLRGLRGGGGTHSAEPATFHFTGTTTGSGSFTLDGGIDPLRKPLFCTLKAALEHQSLPALNPSAAHLDGLTFASGSFDGYVEITIREQVIDGYIKTLFRDLDIARFRSEAGGDARKLFWKAAIALGEAILPNDDTGALAAKIPVHGRIDAPDTDAWQAIGSTLRNAFLTAILPGFDVSG